MTKTKASPSHAASYDVVGRYRQDRINGFRPNLLDRFIDLLDPYRVGSVLDAMGGDGNLSRRILERCREFGHEPPRVTLLEFSRVQTEFARSDLDGLPVDVVWGDALGMVDRRTGEPLPDESFDRVAIKSGNHEIPLARQRDLYASAWRVLKPGGLFANLGFLFEEVDERDEFREITRVKDALAGLASAAIDRHFLTREELYSRLEEVGFVDLRCGHAFEYTIHSAVAAEEYFSRPGLEQAVIELQCSQARAMTLRRRGRIRFEGEHTTMRIPGEVTVCRKPTVDEERGRTFRRYPLDFLRRIAVHAELLDRVVDRIPAGARVLDLGCGPGLLAERLTERARSYLGVDLEPDFVGACWQRFAGQPSFRFEAADAAAYDPPGGEFDVVAVLNTVHLPGVDALAILRRAHAALAPGGRLVVSGPTSRESFARIEPAIRAQLEADGVLPAQVAEFDAVCEANRRLLTARGNYWSVEGMVALLAEIGFASCSLADPTPYHGAGWLIVAEK